LQCIRRALRAFLRSGIELPTSRSRTGISRAVCLRFLRSCDPGSGRSEVRLPSAGVSRRRLRSSWYRTVSHRYSRQSCLPGITVIQAHNAPVAVAAPCTSRPAPSRLENSPSGFDKSSGMDEKPRQRWIERRRHECVNDRHHVRQCKAPLTLVRRLFTDSRRVATFTSLCEVNDDGRLVSTDRWWILRLPPAPAIPPLLPRTTRA
jgi:hypothetical protein